MRTYTNNRHPAVFAAALLAGGAAAALILQHFPAPAGLLSYVEFVLIAAPILFACLYLFLVRNALWEAVSGVWAVDRATWREDLTGLVKRNWDVILVLLLVSFLFLYRLETWNIIRLEEWRRYRFFVDGNWLHYRSGHKLNTVFLPTFLIAALFPFDSVLGYRYVAAGLSIVGGVFFYLAIRYAAKSRLVAGLATIMVVTHTWILLFGRMFFVSWSALTLSSLSLLVFVRFRETGFKATAVTNGISVLNFAQSVFFVFPFLILERIHTRKDTTLWQAGFPLILIAIILIPSFFLFVAEQPRRVGEEQAIYGEDPVAHITLPGVDRQVYWPLSISDTFTALHNYLSITDAPRRYPTFSLWNRYSLLAALLIIYPLLALKFSRWEYRVFFGGSALLSIAALVLFPMTVNVAYPWPFFMFLAPLLAEGAVKSPYRAFRAFSIILLVSVVAVQGVDSFDDIILYDAEAEFDRRIGPHVENETFLVGDEVPAIIEESPLDPLEGYDYIPVDSCPAIRRTALKVVVADPFCASPEKSLVSETRMLFLYE